jgi:hypothetical protein
MSILAGLANSPPEFYRPDIKKNAENNKIDQGDRDAANVANTLFSKNRLDPEYPETQDPTNPEGDSNGVLGLTLSPESPLLPTSLEIINRTAAAVPDLNLTNLFRPKDVSKLGKYGGTTNLIPNSGYTQAAGKDLLFNKMKGADERQGQMSYRFDFDTSDGASYEETEKTQGKVYMPFSITDLRYIDGANGFRTVYLQPFITNLQQSFSPSWNMQQFFGRVDPVATYQATGRTWSMGFKMVAFHPSDLPVIYQKMNWIQSMVYPEYDENVRFKSGPVVRLRLGNIIDGAGFNAMRGLPGVITQLDFDYSETIWEVEADWQVPRNINVSLGFQVLHELPIGSRGGAFGGIGEVDGDGNYLTPKQMEKLGTASVDTIQPNVFNTAGVPKNGVR